MNAVLMCLLISLNVFIVIGLCCGFISLIKCENIDYFSSDIPAHNRISILLLILSFYLR